MQTNDLYQITISAREQYLKLTVNKEMFNIK